ncbi:hypothetical protein BDN72DRAFT_878010 [Pluteus cervinus]|uniref:Uncharacterized protein n=1 Tax=Pluteus cervinus TaxID=181527 RepID=A0ACD3AXT4_9AGAR|nr:hypothetical protein BDN72DRAFT_878010 [Pluteus cervinus]
MALPPHILSHLSLYRTKQSHYRQWTAPTPPKFQSTQLQPTTQSDFVDDHAPQVERPKSPFNESITLLVDEKDSPEEIYELQQLLRANPEAGPSVKHFELFTRTIEDVANPVLSTIVSKLSELESFSWCEWDDLPCGLRFHLRQRFNSPKFIRASLLAITDAPHPRGPLSSTFTCGLKALELSYPTRISALPTLYALPHLQTITIHLDALKTGEAMRPKGVSSILGGTNWGIFLANQI